jgi:hypothetical protein
MGIAADRAVRTRRPLEIQVRERVRLARAGLDAEVPEQRFADEVRRLAGRFADAEVDRRLAEMNGAKLRVRIGHVQQAHVAEALDRVVERASGLEVERRARVERQARDRAGRDELHEVAPVHGADRRATGSPATRGPSGARRRRGPAPR